MPFAGYKNFADCVKQNSSKKDPKAYCSTIMRATEASLNTANRKKWAKQGIALPDGSYPIPTVGFLKKAIKSFGRNPTAAVKRHIIKRARALGRTDLLPENWSVKKRAKASLDPRFVHEVIEVQEADFTKGEDGRMTADVVLIRAGRAKNPRNYRASALEQAAREGVYNGLKMFVNHSDQPPVRRDFRDFVSAVESTRWDPAVKPEGGIRGTVTFVDEGFFTKAQAAKDFIGLSADHRIKVAYTQEGTRQIEDVLQIVGARSVDWVLYPSAGGEILSFAQESEGEDQVQWDEITLDQLKENVPDLLKEFATAAREDEDPDDDDEEDEGGEEGVKLPKNRQELQQLVTEQVTSILDKQHDEDAKRRDATKRVREIVGKSGLPSRTQARLVNQFADDTAYDEKAVKEAIDDAKEELKEAGARGPRISGMGPSGDHRSSGEGEGKHTVSVRESVEAEFGIKATKEGDSKDKKES